MRYLATFALAAAAFAQQQQPQIPHIGFVYPAGGRQGASLELTVGGQFLNNADQVIEIGPSPGYVSVEIDVDQRVPEHIGDSGVTRQVGELLRGVRQSYPMAIG